MQSFSRAVDFCIREKVDMVLISGDLFDSAYPPIDTLKRTFQEFKKLYDAKIKCFIIAGSHDYSVAGKTFLDVLEHAGFCKNVFSYEERDGKINLQPTIFNNYAIYGYPGMKTGLEVEGLKKVDLEDAPGFFKIFMLHTTLREAIGDLPIECISISELPKADYYALSHLHVNFKMDNLAYSGPIFPNNFEELVELKHGRFDIIEVNEGMIKREKIELKLKEVVNLEIEIDNLMTGTEKVIRELDRYNLEDKIVLVKLYGKVLQGKVSDLRFDEIEKFVKSKGAYVFVKNTSKLEGEKLNIEIEKEDMHKVEDKMIEEYFEKNPSRFSGNIQGVLRALSIEKQEDEKNSIFHDRLVDELKKVLEF